MLDAWLSAQRQGIARYAAEMSTWAGPRRDFDLASPDLPAEVAECLFHALRATVSIIAISCAVIGEQRVEPWLARALTERFLESTKHVLGTAAVDRRARGAAVLDREFACEALELQR